MAKMFENQEEKNVETSAEVQEELNSLGPQEEVTPPAEPSEEVEEEGGFDYAAFAEEEEIGEEEVEASTPSEEVPAEKQPPEASQEEEEEKEEPASVTPEEKPTEEGKPEEPKEEVVEKKEETPVSTTPTETPEQYQARLDQARESARKSLESRYKLTEEEADEFLSDPAAAVPKALARVYTDVYEQVLGDMKAMIPNVVQQVQVQEKGKEEAWNEFNQMFPQLKGKESDVEQVVSTHLQMAQAKGESLTREQLFKRAGLQVCIMHQLPIPPELLGEGSQVVQRREEAPASTTPPPFTPSSPGQPNSPTGASHLASAPSVWEELATDEEDYGD